MANDLKMYCSKCGANNPDNATFCSACGNQLTAQSPSMPGYPSAPPAPASSPYNAMPAQRKSEVLAALLSFFFFGAGYLYLGYKKVLGVPTIWFVIIVFLVDIVLTVLTGLWAIVWFIAAIVMAYDSWKKGKGEKGIIGTEPQFLYGGQTYP